MYNPPPPPPPKCIQDFNHMLINLGIIICFEGEHFLVIVFRSKEWEFENVLHIINVSALSKEHPCDGHRLVACERRVQHYCETTFVIVSEIVQRMCSTDCKTFCKTIIQMSGTFLDVFTGEPKYIGPWAFWQRRRTHVDLSRFHVLAELLSKRLVLFRHQFRRLDLSHELYRRSSNLPYNWSPVHGKRGSRSCTNFLLMSDWEWHQKVSFVHHR